MTWLDYLIPLVKRHEGLRLDAYRDPVGVWTIGYGHTSTARPGQTITEAQAEALLRKDVAWAEQAVDRAVKVPLEPQEKAALVSLTFNIGAGAFRGSTLVRKLNAGDRLGAANEFPKWRMAGGRVLAGLVRRREEERALFMEGRLEHEAEVVAVDAPVEGGEQKPLPKSRTAVAAGGGIIASTLAIWREFADSVPELVWTVGKFLPLVLLAIALFIFLNRWREARKGEH